MVDEDLYQTCSTDCGKGQSQCVLGSWLSCDAKEPTEEECNGLDDNCDGLVDNHEDCYPSVPDIVWEDDVVESEEEVEFDLTILQDEEKEDKAPESIEDPFEQADVIWQEDPWSTQEAEPEEEILVEVHPANGCHQTDKKATFWKLFILLLTMYALGGIFGWLAARHKED